MQKNVSTNIHIPQELWKNAKIRAAEEGKTLRQLVLEGLRLVLGQVDRESPLASIEAALTDRKTEEFCRRWKIQELALFGSALGDDFGPDSDIDLLVSFADDAPWSLFDHMAMEEELSRLLGRKVDLVSRKAVEQSSNWIRRRAILENAVPYYVA